jgi:hypothetical protein
VREQCHVTFLALRAAATSAAGLGALVPVLARAGEEVGAGGEGVAIEVESRRQERLYPSRGAPGLA